MSNFAFLQAVGRPETSIGTSDPPVASPPPTEQGDGG